MQVKSSSEFINEHGITWDLNKDYELALTCVVGKLSSFLLDIHF